MYQSPQNTLPLQPSTQCLGKEITTTDFINESKYIHPITNEAALEVVSNLRPEDRREVVEGQKC